MSYENDEDIEPAKPRVNKLYAAAALATLLVAGIRGVTLLQGMNDDAPPPAPSPEPIAAPEPAAPPTSPPAPPATEPAPKPAAKTAAASAEARLWKAFEARLEEGHADRAFIAWTEWKAKVGKDDPEAWEKALDAHWPEENRRQLVLNSTCASCNDGGCERCDGSGKCRDCNGKKACTACEGKRQFTENCMACLCGACKYTGRCRNCQGRGRLVCATCKGSGHGQPIVKTATCNNCAGKGRIARKYRDSFYTCPRCHGHGKFVSRRNTPCTTCKGSKFQACSTCHAQGLCTTCRGSGRKLSCSSCKGRGKIIHTCKTCRGVGSCTTCRGLGRCGTCNGLGACTACLGNNVHAYKRMVISADYLPENASGIVIDEEGWRTVSPPSSNDGKLIISCGGRDCTLEPGDGVFHLISDRNAFHLHDMTRPAPEKKPATP